MILAYIIITSMKQEYRVLPISSLTISVPVILFIEKLVFIFIPFLRYITYRFKLLNIYIHYIWDTRELTVRSSSKPMGNFFAICKEWFDILIVYFRLYVINKSYWITVTVTLVLIFAHLHLHCTHQHPCNNSKSCVVSWPDLSS